MGRLIIQISLETTYFTLRGFSRQLLSSALRFMAEEYPTSSHIEVY
jgi:hypothetical protein